MDTQDGREHTTLGMEKIIRIFKCPPAPGAAGVRGDQPRLPPHRALTPRPRG
jgi:hypothetical protein